MLSIVMGNATDRKSLLVILVLDRNNFDRMKKGDPATIQLDSVPLPEGALAERVEIMVCYEEDIPRVLELQNAKDGRVVLAHLCRGWTTQHDDGMPPMRPTRPQ